MKYKIILLIVVVLLVSHVSAQQTGDPIPVDKGLSKQWYNNLYHDHTQAVYRGEQLKTIGMPIGGIAAGQLYIRGDGTFARWWIANNAYNTGCGSPGQTEMVTPFGVAKNCYQTYTPESYVDQGFKISIKTTSGKSITKNLNKEDFDNVSFIGEYPIAIVNYADKRTSLPVAITMKAFTPFIPLDAKESATPGTYIIFKLKNTGKGKLNINLTGWLQNMVCQDIAGKAAGILRNRAVSDNQSASLVMDMLEDKSQLPANDIKTHPYFGNLALTVLDTAANVITNTDNNSKAASTKKLGEKLVGQVGINLSLAPGQERDITFMLTWFFPNRPQQYNGFDFGKALPTAGPAIGNMYANWYSSALDVAHWMRDNRLRLITLTDLFHDTYYSHTTLPYWLNQRIMMPVSTLATETCEWWGNGKFYAYEGVGSCNGTCTHVWNYEQALAHLFPELEQNIREKTDFGTSFQDDGGIQTRNGQDGVKIDGHAGGILKAYREYLLSDNLYFLSRNWDKIKLATLYIIHQDSLDGKIDGMISGEQPNTYDVAFYGANTYVGGLYLAALQSAEKMALIMNDKSFADTCKMIYEMGKQQTIKRLWTGEYFKQDVDNKKYPDEQYSDGCLSDQLFGQTWAHLLDLGYIYPEDMVKKTLSSTWKYNWTTDVGAYNKTYEPNRFYASDKEPGLLITTWPGNDYLKTGVMYKNEVWTGVEYQVATNMIYEGMIDEGLSIVRGIHERYNPEKHNPWNEVECGDHYARAMASWGVLLALEDYNYNGPQGEFSFAPKLSPPNFESFFTTAKGWGNILQQQTNGLQSDELKLMYGELQLRQFAISLVGNTVPKTVTLFADGKMLPVKWFRDGQKIIISGFDQTLYAGQTLKLKIETVN